MGIERTSKNQAAVGRHVANVASDGAIAVPAPVSRRTWAALGGAVVFGVALAGCSSVDSVSSKIDPTYGVEVSPRVVADGDPVPKGGGHYKVGKPYKVAGRTYVPEEDADYVAEGMASWYGKDFHGRKTANGEVFDMTSISAAHKTLPMPSYVRVTNLANKRSIIVRVNNRGPYVAGRVVDVSYRTAELLGFARHGVARVRVEYVGRAPLGGSDDQQLAMSLSTDGVPAQLNGSSPVMVASAKPFVPHVAEALPVGSGDAPMPVSRPYDLGGEMQVAAAAPETMAAPEPPVVASKPAASSKPNSGKSVAKPAPASATRVAAAPSTKPASAKPAPATGAAKPTPKPSATAIAVAPSNARSVSMAANGWSTGPSPVSGLSYAGVSGSEGFR